MRNRQSKRKQPKTATRREVEKGIKNMRLGFKALGKDLKENENHKLKLAERFNRWSEYAGKVMESTTLVTDDSSCEFDN